MIVGRIFKKKCVTYDDCASCFWVFCSCSELKTSLVMSGSFEEHHMSFGGTT